MQVRWSAGRRDYETTFAAYSGHVKPLLRIPSDDALRLFCRSVSLKDVPSVTEFVRSLMLEPQDTAAYLDGIEKHFHDLDHIHTELLATTPAKFHFQESPESS